MKKARWPPGLFNVVPGGRETAEALAAHSLVARVGDEQRRRRQWLARAAGAKKFRC